jgi:hypothetical protein
MPKEGEWRLCCVKDEGLKVYNFTKTFPSFGLRKAPLGLAHKHPPIMVDLMLGGPPHRGKDNTQSH